MNSKDVTHILDNMQKRVERVQDELQKLGVDISVITDSNLTLENVNIENDVIYKALLDVGENIGNAYAQVLFDMADESRVSWVGTAHSIRQILSWVLAELAPDSEVKAQPNFKSERQNGNPSQKQSALYILKKNKTDSSKVKDVIKEIDQVDERIARFTRLMYGRASDASHRSKDKTEVKRILKYFNAIVHDLLDIQE